MAQLDLLTFRPATFDGATFDRDRDGRRLEAQLQAVLTTMRDGAWHTLSELQTHVPGSTASISSRIRDLRKERFGNNEIQTRFKSKGVWEYRLSNPSERR